MRSILVLGISVVGCCGVLDAGWDVPKGVLPVDQRNPVVLCNDGAYDDWQGEYALLFANSGGPNLAGIVINDGWPWTNLDENIAGWRQMVAAARQSGLSNLPDPITSSGPVLVRPDDGNIDSTIPNRSEGARFIIDASRRWWQPSRPLVVITGGRLTDVADAYLMDPTLPERIVVVASLGTANDSGGEMGLPNGQLDSWSDIIVAQKFRYVQVSSYYDALTDVPENLLSQLPDNAFTSWIASKQPGVAYAYDQVGYQVVAMPELVSKARKVVQRGESTEKVPLLVNDAEGTAMVVSDVSHALATAKFWELLLDPATFR
ncbi:MAG TPA: hypothetical protein VKP30_09885 [Polyangiaceae bacterium]|nr:hypothetical protein [Polyangiaceae bacterium]